MDVRMNQKTYEYVPTALVRFFHAFPHLNITLHRVDSTFTPESSIYLESLGILGSMPAAWLILTLLVLLIYLLTRCCDRKPRPKHSIVALKWTLAIFTLLCCAAVGVGLYGNDDVHNALVQFVTATRNIDGTIMTVRNQTRVIETTLQLKVMPLLIELGDEFDSPVANQTARALLLESLEAVKGNRTLAWESSQDISKPLQHITLTDFVFMTELSENIRWPCTMAVLSILLVFCVVLLFGVARHSRCALITFSVFGLFAVIISWLMASLYLATAVALGDLCISPETFLGHEVEPTLKSDFLMYYIRCDMTRTNPFNQRLLQGQRAVKGMSSGLAVVSKLARELYKNNDLYAKLSMLTTDINQADKLMSGLATSLDCTSLHRQYISAANSVCDLGLYGLTFMLLASVAAGFFFTVLVWVDSHTWIYIRKRRDYLQVDEQDPFLPPSAASQAIAARTLRSQGSYGSTGYFRPRHSPHHHHTPPPTPPYPGTLDGRASREEKPQHSSHYESAGGGNCEYGASSMLGPNHGQYPTLSKQCKTLESSDFY